MLEAMNLSEKRNRRPYYVFLELVQATASAQVLFFSRDHFLVSIYLIKHVLDPFSFLTLAMSTNQYQNPLKESV